MQDVQPTMREAPLYPRVLGPAWLRLAGSLRLVHTTDTSVRAHGRFRICYGPSRTARCLAWLMRLPRASEAAETRLVVTPCAGGERWLRTFDGRRLDTRQYHAGDSVLGERLGILDFRFRIEVSDGLLFFTQLEVAFVLGPVRVRLPARWAPTVVAREEPAGARRTYVNVHVVLPSVGNLMAYEGTMDFEETPV